MRGEHRAAMAIMLLAGISILGGGISVGCLVLDPCETRRTHRSLEMVVETN